MDQLFSNPEGPASTNSGRVIEAVPDDPVLALRAREERKANGGQLVPQDEIIDAEIVEEVEIIEPVVDDKAAERKKNREIKAAEKVSAEALMAEAGLEPIYSTTEAAEFFERSNQWLYWGLRNGVFEDDDGNSIDPDRIGDPKTGRRRFTLTIVKQILLSSYRRGNIEPDELTRILRRIKIAKAGGEWREREGWHRVQISKNKTRWVHPDKCERKGNKWVLQADAELEND